MNAAVEPEVLAAVLAEPDLLGTLSRPALVALRRRLAHLIADADALLSPLSTMEPEAAPKVLTLDEAALLLRCSKDSLHRKHRKLKLGFIDKLDGKLKFLEPELRAYLARVARLSRA